MNPAGNATPKIIRASRVIHGAVLILAAVVAVSGCAGNRIPRADRSTGTADPDPARAAQAVLTTDAATLRQRWYLFRAEQTLDELCMRRKGYRYLITSPGPEPDTRTATADAVGSDSPPTYGVATQPAASTSPAAQAGITAQDRYVSSLPVPLQTRYLEALEGLPAARATLNLPSGASGTYPTGGCVADARRQLYGSVRAALEDPLVPQDVTAQFHAFLRSYQPYQAALQTWQRCMAAAGSPFATPAAAIESIRVLAATGANAADLDRRQATSARADVACDARSHLRARTSDGQAATLRALPQTTLDRLQKVYRTRQQAVQAAIRILTPPLRMPSPRWPAAGSAADIPAAALSATATSRTAQRGASV